MRIIVSLSLALALAGCVTVAPRTVTQTPAGISYSCEAAFGGCQSSPQGVADSAQQHCRQFGKNAQQTMLAIAPSGNLRASFICV